MPSIRKPLTIRQKLIALYSDSIVFALADHVARETFHARPGSSDYRRHVTSFLLNVEARLHGNRQKTQASAQDTELWTLRRELAFRTTGHDVILTEVPTAVALRQWHYRFVPSPIAEDEELREADLVQRLTAAAEKYREGLPQNLASLVTRYEQLSMEFAVQLGQFPTKGHPTQQRRRNLAKLKRQHLVMADGTYLTPYSGVSWYIDEEGNPQWLGGVPARKGEPTLQAVFQHSGKQHGPSAGVNHVAVITRARWGRIVLSVERALGGENHAALRAMDRIAPLARGGIRGLVYDKGLEGWCIDYLTAHHAILCIVEPKAKTAQTPVEKDVARAVANLVEARTSAAGADEDACRPAASEDESGTPGRAAQKKKTKVNGAIKAAMARHALGQHYKVKRLIADAEAGRPLGGGLQLGTSVYLNSAEAVIPVASRHLLFDTQRHRVDNEWCEHELHVDDGALWDTRLEKGLRVKDQRLECVRAEARKNPHTGWWGLRSSYRFTCEYTGEVLRREVDHYPSGEWDPSNRPKRSPRHHMQPTARCDRGWRGVYGYRVDCESWFSWMKAQLLEDRRAASLDLNHQYLDVLFAGIITNAITRYHWALEAHL